MTYGAGVQESSTTTGTGTLTLTGAPTGMQTFSTGIGNGATCLYRVDSQDGGWEEGLGTVAAGTLARTTVYNSSNAGAAVNFTTPLTIRNIANTRQLNGLTPQSYIAGLLPSWSSTTVLGVGAGSCKDSTNVRDIVLPSAFTKGTGAWAVGTGNGGKLSAAAFAASTAYHWYVIIKDADGTVDVGFDTSPTAPTMPSGYTYFRRIYSMNTNGSTQWTQFRAVLVGTSVQFVWDVPVQSINVTNPGTARVSRTLTVPTGIVIRPNGTCYSRPVDNAFNILITNLDQTDTAAAAGQFTYKANVIGTAIGFTLAGQYYTNTSGQIGVRQDASGTNDELRIFTMGWYDDR